MAQQSINTVVKKAFSDRSKKLWLSFLILASLCAGNSLRAQNIDHGLAVYFSNPVGLLSKFRIKAEYRIDIQKSVLVSFTKYWGVFPGYQAGAEYRSYWETLGVHEYYVYGKGGLGNVSYKKPPIIKDDAVYVAPGNYFFGGAGVGKHWTFNHFFIDANLGAKFTGVASPGGDYNEVLFYLSGPGSILDLNLHLGFQL